MSQEQVSVSVLAFIRSLLQILHLKKPSPKHLRNINTPMIVSMAVAATRPCLARSTGVETVNAVIIITG
jgi:hypothetical protein